MSILIKGMEMPTGCAFCRIKRRNGKKMVCPLLDEEWDIHDPMSADHRLDNCPLVPVPPHYDLIDHNALKIAVMDCDAETRIDFLKHAMDCINKAPVVIPSDMPTYEAEEGET